jgi:redox-sensitive bicupin YhaK (pirin superfamily)
MTTMLPLQRMNRGSHFRAFGLHGNEMGLVDPFLGVDHAWISGPTFPPHPHAGFSAVSYLFLDSETGIDNRDSLGNRNVIEPGGLHWTAAGRGIVHEEVPVETGKTVHMLQIFINLARAQQSAAPFALSLPPQDVPAAHLPGIKIRVPLGGYAALRSPLLPPTEVALLDISFDDKAEMTVPIEVGDDFFVMPIHGAITVDGQRFSGDELQLPAFPATTAKRSVTLQAKHGSAKVALFAGHPLRQPVFWQGSMAMASEQALAAATLAYRRGEFGAL